MSPTFVEISRELGPGDMGALEGVARRIADGALAGLPTETVFGLCASIHRPDALDRLTLIKGRPEDAPFAMFVPDLAAAMEWAEVPPWAVRLLREVWPGPLTVILQSRREETRALGARDTVGIRIPAHPVPQQILRMVEGPIAATSANRSGKPSLLTAEAVRAEFGLEVDVVVRYAGDGTGLASTVVDLCGDRPKVLRPGGISEAQLEAYLRRE
jgi:L-threonylcarbamoyladenylate synthase